MPHNVRPRDDLPADKKRFVEKMIIGLHNVGAFMLIKRGSKLTSVRSPVMAYMTTSTYLFGDKNFAVGKLLFYADKKEQRFEDYDPVMEYETRLVTDAIVLNQSDPAAVSVFETYVKSYKQKFDDGPGSLNAFNIGAFVDGISGFYVEQKADLSKLGVSISTHALSLYDKDEDQIASGRVVRKTTFGELTASLQRTAVDVTQLEHVPLYTVDVINYSDSASSL